MASATRGSRAVGRHRGASSSIHSATSWASASKKASAVRSDVRRVIGCGGIQPVATATANGAARAEVGAGAEGVFAVEAEVPVGAGSIVEIAWDFDGSGTWPEVHV